MKAWLAREKDSEYATVVFAETRGKARALAMATDACEDADFCDIDVSRKPQMDKYYKEGKKEMDWYDDKDRLALVKECRFYCVESDLVECDQCPAKKYCSEYEERLEYLKDCEEYTETVHCKDCEYLMFSDCYGECSQAYKGIVYPDDSCGKGKKKNAEGEK